MLNEHLFYGGIFLCACSVGLAVILGSLYTIQKIRLNSKLNEEYGKEIKGSNKAGGTRWRKLLHRRIGS